MKEIQLKFGDKKHTYSFNEEEYENAFNKICGEIIQIFEINEKDFDEHFILYYSKEENLTILTNDEDIKEFIPYHGSAAIILLKVSGEKKKKWIKNKKSFDARDINQQNQSEEDEKANDELNQILKENNPEFVDLFMKIDQLNKKLKYANQIEPLNSSTLTVDSITKTLGNYDHQLKCNQCSKQIVGIRMKCSTCTENYNLCNDCYILNQNNHFHKCKQFIRISNSQAYQEELSNKEEKITCLRIKQIDKDIVLNASLDVENPDNVQKNINLQENLGMQKEQLLEISQLISNKDKGNITESQILPIDNINMHIKYLENKKINAAIPVNSNLNHDYQKIDEKNGNLTMNERMPIDHIPLLSEARLNKDKGNITERQIPPKDNINIPITHIQLKRNQIAISESDSIAIEVSCSPPKNLTIPPISKLSEAILDKDKGNIIEEQILPEDLTKRFELKNFTSPISQDEITIKDKMLQLINALNALNANGNNQQNENLEVIKKNNPLIELHNSEDYLIIKNISQHQEYLEVDIQLNTTYPQISVVPSSKQSSIKPKVTSISMNENKITFSFEKMNSMRNNLFEYNFEVAPDNELSNSTAFIIRLIKNQ